MKRILIVDDNQMLANMYRGALASAGFQVEVAHDGEAGLRAAQQVPPDVVLLDLMMPRMTGLQMLNAIREDPALARTAVIILSNSYTPERTADAWNGGGTQVLVEASSSPKQVLEAVRTAMQGS